MAAAHATAAQEAIARARTRLENRFGRSSTNARSAEPFIRSTGHIRKGFHHSFSISKIDSIAEYAAF